MMYYNTTTKTAYILSEGKIVFKDCDEMFENKTNIISIVLNNVKTEHITSMSRMFANCTSLKTLDLSNFDTENLKTTSLSSFDSGMFYNCKLLTTIYVGSKWDLTNVEPYRSMYMFYGCISLVGGEGTTFNSSHQDSEYARVDGGESNPGYLTLKT